MATNRPQGKLPPLTGMKVAPTSELVDDPEKSIDPLYLAKKEEIELMSSDVKPTKDLSKDKEDDETPKSGL